MREIEGFLCTAKFLEPVNQELLFGPDTSDQVSPFDRFVTNGLIPFTDLTSAQNVLVELEKRKTAFGFVRTGLVEVQLQITDSDDEIELLRTKSNFIIVAEIEDGEVRLLGQQVDGIPGICYAPVSDLELNGLKPMSNFEQAGNQTFGALSEVRRQGKIPSHLATFSLTRVK